MWVLAKSRLRRKPRHCRPRGDLGAIDADEKDAVFTTRKPMQMLNHENAVHIKKPMAFMGLDGIAVELKRPRKTGRWQ
jgi:hypothetical protein